MGFNLTDTLPGFLSCAEVPPQGGAFEGFLCGGLVQERVAWGNMNSCTDYVGLVVRHNSQMYGPLFS